MADFSLVPVDYQPDFSDFSLVPVDYDPFGADGAQQPGMRRGSQAQPPATGAVYLDIGGQFSDGDKTADIARSGIGGAPRLAPSVAPSDGYAGKSECNCRSSQLDTAASMVKRA
jgi:hypothetical protein